MHWTFGKIEPDDSLAQGDIIHPKDELSALLREVHPWFDKGKYIGFIVATQTCDLKIRSNDKCGTRHITLAPIRSLDVVLANLLDETCDGIGEQVYYKKCKQDARRLIGRIINQNETALGLFYLHADPESGIAVPSVATLRIKLSIRRSGYDALRNARAGRLKPEFQARLGCMIGELYSRVAVEDWAATQERKDQQKEIVDGFIDGPQLRNQPLWVDSKTARAAAKSIDIAAIPRENLEAELERFRQNPEELVAESLADALRSVPELESAAVAKIVTHLKTKGSNKIRQAINLAVDQMQND